MTSKPAMTYTLLLQIATTKLQAGDYMEASRLLSHCCSLTSPSVSTQWSDADLLNYCKATILLAATRLRLHQDAIALQDFSQALKTLQSLYAAASDEEARTVIRRYQAVLIRANQTACTLSRLSKSVEVCTYEQATQDSHLH